MSNFILPISLALVMSNLTFIIGIELNRQLSTNSNAIQPGDRNGFYAGWDADGDNQIAESEFNHGWNIYMQNQPYDRELFDQWDRDKDGIMKLRELGEGLYDYFDGNRDELLNETEFLQFSDNGFYNSWDLDQDQALELNEFEKGWDNNFEPSRYDAGFFDRWDANENDYIDDEEFSSGLYDLIDEDESGYVDYDEFNL
ncbi:MAG: hypothetical protein ACNS62_12920 [Candidatus Cyclobacteriaceae bacterium M3_2C_046]